MITYEGTLFNIHLLFRIHGSAVYKAIVPTFVSTAFYFAVRYNYPNAGEIPTKKEFFQHPYAIGVVMGAYTFMLAFRVTHSYSRFWEAASHIYGMQSKLLNVGVQAASFHYQSSTYDESRPTAFGVNPNIEVKRKRSEVRKTVKELKNSLEQKGDVSKKKKKSLWERFSTKGKPIVRYFSNIEDGDACKYSKDRIRLHFSRMASYPDGLSSDNLNDNAPSLFLQEAAHLISLASGVALSSLRMDVEDVVCALEEFEENQEWPPVDPDKANVSEEKIERFPLLERNFRFLCGVSRSAKSRTYYNHIRPISIVGGVSKNEIKALESARGGMARVSLCIMWLQEFLAREYLASSMGPVHPPILSRLFGDCSDGLTRYNNARKISFIPFPFVHSQLSAIYAVLVLVVVPVMIISYVKQVTIGAILNTFTVLCFGGLHEVARELESPFTNEPNDLPLVTLQAQFNEALLSMVAGFHPDAKREENYEDEILKSLRFSNDSLSRTYL